MPRRRMQSRQTRPRPLRPPAPAPAGSPPSGSGGCSAKSPNSSSSSTAAGAAGGSLEVGEVGVVLHRLIANNGGDARPFDAVTVRCGDVPGRIRGLRGDTPIRAAPERSPLVVLFLHHAASAGRVCLCHLRFLPTRVLVLTVPLDLGFPQLRATTDRPWILSSTKRCPVAPLTPGRFPRSRRSWRSSTRRSSWC